MRSVAPKPVPRISFPAIIRFWNKVRVGSDDQCWEWTGVLQPRGYGQFGLRAGGGGMVLTHRIAWTLYNSEIPAGMCVLHRCDNRACCNPAHLFLGTYLDNHQDMQAKGRVVHATGDRSGARKHPERWRRGESHRWSVLTDAQVQQIRERHVKGRTRYEPGNTAELAREFGVSKTHVLYIVSHRAWAHVP